MKFPRRSRRCGHGRVIAILDGATQRMYVCTDCGREVQVVDMGPLDRFFGRLAIVLTACAVIACGLVWVLEGMRTLPPPPHG